LTAHYRKQLNFTFEGLDQSKAALDRLYTFIDRLRKLPLEPGESDEVNTVAAKATAEFELR